MDDNAQLLQEGIGTLASPSARSRRGATEATQHAGAVNADGAGRPGSHLQHRWCGGGGNTYGAAKDVGVYVTGGAIRGLAHFEAKGTGAVRQPPRKAVAAGLSQRMVRVAEQQGALIAQVIRGVLDRLNPTLAQRVRRSNGGARSYWR